MQSIDEYFSQETLDLSELIQQYPKESAKFNDLPFEFVSELENIPTCFKVTSISEINQTHHIVLLKCTIVRVSVQLQNLDISPKSVCKWIEYKCSSCGALQRIYSDPTNYYLIENPKKCQEQTMKQVKFHPFFKTKGLKYKKGACSSTTFTKTDQSQLEDYQEIKVQDPYTTLKPGMISNSIKVILEGKFVNSCKSGENIVIGGLIIQRWKMSKQKPNISLWIQCKYLGKLTLPPRALVLEITTDHIMQRAKILQSFHPQLCGLWDVKLAILLCLIGGESITLEEREQEEMYSTCMNHKQTLRGNSHLLLVGEPGTGKSSLLRQAAKISDKAIYVNGIGTTQAGLTVSFVKEGSDWMIDAGALVLTDQGVCCIDEFNLIPQQSQQGILEALEQQTISSSKAGISTKLNARTTIIAACNPIGQKYNCNLDVQQNTGLSTPLLSRFDIIMVMRDQHDLELDQQLCEHILFQKQKGDFSPDELKSYISHIKSIEFPTLNHKCQKVLQNYYCKLRQMQPNTTIRKLEALIRMCQAHAKLCYRNKIDEFDVISVIALQECSYTTGIHQDIQEVLYPTVDKNTIQNIWEYLILEE